jgi:hypothetical protein
LNTLVNFESAQPSQSDQFSVGVNSWSCFQLALGTAWFIELPAAEHTRPAIKDRLRITCFCGVFLGAVGQSVPHRF